MQPTAVQQRAAARAQQLPGASLEHPFGPEWDVFKVRGKVFMLQTSVTGAPLVTVKAAPEDGEALRAQFASITPGYHMHKRHWITIHATDPPPLDLVDELVTESYRLVVAGLPRAERPVDPDSFGEREGP